MSEKGIFYSRPSAEGENYEMIKLRKEYEATCGRVVEHSEWAEIFSGAWVTGPVSRKHPECNWSDVGKVQTPCGLVEDHIPEDLSLVLNTPKGLVTVIGCGHAGVINILTYARKKLGNRPLYAVVGGLHLFSASDGN